MSGRVVSERILAYSMKDFLVELRLTKSDTRNIFEWRLLLQNLPNLLSKLARDYRKMELASVS